MSGIGSKIIWAEMGMLKSYVDWIYMSCIYKNKLIIRK